MIGEIMMKITIIIIKYEYVFYYEYVCIKDIYRLNVNTLTYHFSPIMVSTMTTTNPEGTIRKVKMDETIQSKFISTTCTITMYISKILD